MGRKNYLIEGLSGTGKTSVADELQRRGHHVVHGDRELSYQGDPETGEPTHGGGHAHHIWDVAKVRALVRDQSQPVTFFCGGSRNVSKFVDLFDAVFVLEVDLPTLHRRLDARPDDEWGGGHPTDRDLITLWHETHGDVPQDGIAIDATAPIGHVVDEIIRRCQTGSPAVLVESAVPAQTLLGLFRRFLRFGVLAWGGPIAQIAMLRRELVDTERWISSDRFNRTLAVYQALPGPEAHELCVYFGYLARGRIGGLLAGLGFMLPGLALMLLLSWVYVSVGLESPMTLAFFAGAQASVLALIVRGTHRIGRHAVTDRWLGVAALLAAAAAIAGAHFVMILGATGLSYLLASRGRAALAAGILAGLVVVSGLTLVARNAGDDPDVGTPAQSGTSTQLATAGPGELLASGLKAGLLTFGGAYTAIPFLQNDIDQGAWMSRETFLDGVALGGILPAPLIIFSTFVGYVAGGLPGALAITAGIFLPAFAITLVGHRQLERLVHHAPMHAVLDGITAGVVGLVVATAVAFAPTALGSVAAVVLFAGSLAVLYAWRSGLAVPVAIIGAGAAGVLLFGVLRLGAAY